MRAALLGLALLALWPVHAAAQVSCNGQLSLGYSAPSPFQVGDTARVIVTLGTGSILGGTTLTLDAVHVGLRCDPTPPIDLSCVAGGPDVTYLGDGTITTTCGVKWTSAPGALPNFRVFTATPAVDIPADKAIPPGFCNLEFDVQVTSAGMLVQVAGYTNLDANCDSGPLNSAVLQTADIAVEVTTTTTTSTTSTTSTTTSTTTTTTSTTTSTTTTSTTTSSTTTTTLGFTRTPGFWENRPTLTDSFLPITVCGVTLTDVAVDDAHSALEAMCGPVQGVDRFQCCRQLTAATLNGVSGGATFADLASCNAICGNPNSSATDVSTCEGEADTFNNSNDNAPTPFPEGNADPGPCHNDNPNAAGTACQIINPMACAIQ